MPNSETFEFEATMDIEKLKKFVFQRRGRYFGIRLIDIPFWEDLYEQFFKIQEITSRDRVESVNGIFASDFQPSEFSSYFDLTVGVGKYPLFQLTNYTYEKGGFQLVKRVSVELKEGRVAFEADEKNEGRELIADGDLRVEVRKLEEKGRETELKESPCASPVSPRSSPQKLKEEEGVELVNGRMRTRKELVDGLRSKLVATLQDGQLDGVDEAAVAAIDQRLSKMDIPELRKECEMEDVPVAEKKGRMKRKESRPELKRDLTLTSFFW